ncbi:DNA replication and repair protein recF [Desulfotomaculum nigrificans CO-1-SRB]|uniref:DNA replication and repair protein RecF n=1 Tax=Desulfotomaculum nigrificans (strain DSM 14880 / VKM B-2319 / CO-1-SRB) TaxID=868595 RepID=F6B3U4_DESCC|nr:DNA replication/repair protein RecF [Desulfotomaculum nigrificans]AEF92909.1 DNA replication and repair protein recF [Desulfotomaculum nigrificans CO-1-SRB]
MRVENITLNNFRNYAKVSFKPHPSINIITGHNAQGKTNLLESIYYSLKGHSFRADRDRDVIKWQQETAVINTEIMVSSRQFLIQWLIKASGKKFRLNGTEVPRAELDQFGVVLFCPEDLYLVKGSPQERRRFLDLEVGPLHPGYSHACRQYARVLSQRNILLKEIRGRQANPDILDIWDEQLYRHGARVIFLRLQVLKKLIPVARSIHLELTNGLEQLQAKYLSSLVLDLSFSEEQIYQVFSQAAKQIRKLEIDRCQTLLGPHRDDISLAINGAEAKTFGSQGQQRTVTLSLKLSVLELWYREFGHYPVLLLDDVLFELDHNRQTMLLDKLQDKVQTFITTSFPGGIDDQIKQVGQIWRVHAGNLTG